MRTGEIIESGMLEGEELEYKSVEARPDKILKELVAFVNTNGGTLLIGLREEEGKIVEFQDAEELGNPSKLEESLQSQVRDKVEPDFQMEYQTVSHAGHTLIRIDVESDTRLHSVEINGKPVFPFRRGSSIGYLGGYELIGEYQAAGPLRSSTESNQTDETGEDEDGKSEEGETSNWVDRTRGPEWSSGTYRTGEVDPPSTPDVPIYSAPAHRLIIETGGHRIATFGNIGIQPFRAPHSTIRVKDRVAIRELNDLQRAFDHIRSILDIGSYRAASYGIKYGSRQLVGRGTDRFVEDAKRIGEVCNRLTPGTETAGTSPRPIGVITFPLPFGICMLELQWDGDSFRAGRSSLQLLLENIPFDLTPYREVFEALGGTPKTFEEQTRLQVLRINGNFPLSDSGVVSFEPNHSRGHNEIAATNPFYDSSDVLQSAFGVDPPNYFLEMLAGINRIPFDVAGGWHPDDKAFRFDHIEMLELDGLLETFVINGLSRVTESDLDEVDAGLNLQPSDVDASQASSE